MGSQRGCNAYTTGNCDSHSDAGLDHLPSQHVNPNRYTDCDQSPLANSDQYRHADFHPCANYRIANGVSYHAANCYRHRDGVPVPNSNFDPDSLTVSFQYSLFTGV